MPQHLPGEPLNAWLQSPPGAQHFWQPGRPRALQRTLSPPPLGGRVSPHQASTHSISPPRSNTFTPLPFEDDEDSTDEEEEELHQQERHPEFEELGRWDTTRWDNASWASSSQASASPMFNGAGGAGGATAAAARQAVGGSATGNSGSVLSRSERARWQAELDTAREQLAMALLHYQSKRAL